MSGRMGRDDVLAYGAARRALYQATPDELKAALTAAADRMPSLVKELRIGEPGASDRIEWFVAQIEGLRQGALRLDAALRDVALTRRGA